MNSKDIAFIFGTTFTGVLILSITLPWLDSRVMGISLLAAGGIIISFMPLVFEKIKERKEAKSE